jgi:PRTRC genetic system ThiF family protein
MNLPTQKFKHYLPAAMTIGGHRARVLVIGAGGNGGPLISGLARMDYALRALGHGGLDVTVMDPDTVAPSNVGRQLYSSADIGRPKCVVSVSRVNLFFGLQWRALPIAFDKEYARDLGSGKCSLVITAVDNVATRKLVHKAVAGKPIYFLDLGNGKRIGQCIVGTGTYIKQPKNFGSECIGHLPTVLDLYPRLSEEETKSHQGDSCSVAASLEKQDLFVNTAVSTYALHLLWEGFRHGYITEHGVFVNLETKRTTPLIINPAVWRDMGWDPEVAFKKRGRKVLQLPIRKAA